MKLRLILAIVALACVGLGAPAFAQAPSAEAAFQRYIANHPEVQRDPSLLSNPAYLNSHPAYTGFLEAHPSIAAQARGTGSWDRNYQWHDADWWHRNDPDWVYEHRPEWNQSHPAWMNDGDYDDAHRWHSRNWWMQNHPNWVKQHRPRWAEAHGMDAEQNAPGHHGNANAYGHYKHEGSQPDKHERNQPGPGYGHGPAHDNH